jgi:hypothetical protein
MNTRSQSAAILQALLRGESITALEALERFGVGRLAARIADIRALGHDVKTAWEKRNGKRYARYYLQTPRLRIIESIPAFPVTPVETKPSNSLF